MLSKQEARAVEEVARNGSATKHKRILRPPQHTLHDSCCTTASRSCSTQSTVHKHTLNKQLSSEEQIYLAGVHIWCACLLRDHVITLLEGLQDCHNSSTTRAPQQPQHAIADTHSSSVGVPTLLRTQAPLFCNTHGRQPDSQDPYGSCPGILSA